jgi:hypothetical protein
VPESPLYIVFWKEAPGQQVSTVVDARDQVVKRDQSYLESNSITVLTDPEAALQVLEQADGTHYAVTPEVARQVLGWDV